MTRLLRIASGTLLVVLSLAVAAAAWLLRDPNRFKPPLEAAMSQRLGMEVHIGGDLDWRLWPPVTLSAESLSTDYRGQSWRVGRIALQVNPLDLMQAAEHWEIDTVALETVTMGAPEPVMEVTEATVSGLALNQPIHVTARVDLNRADHTEPLTLAVDGHLLIEPARATLTLKDTHLTSDAVQGTCNAALWPLAGLPAPAAQDDALVPAALFLNASWQGHCELSRLGMGAAQISGVSLSFDNGAGDSRLRAEAPALFGGSGSAELRLDVRQAPLRWSLRPTLDNVDHAGLARALDTEPLWAGPLSLDGELRATGNSRQGLIETLGGELRLDGGQGRIDISTLRRNLLAVADLVGDADRIRAWPERWDYQRLTATWRPDGIDHRLTGVLDNVDLNGGGSYRPDRDRLDLRFDLTVADDPARPGFDVNPLLYDLPVPLRCGGRLEAADCAVDEAAARQVAAAALRDDGSALRTRLEQRIDQEVPPAYRDAARSLLDLLGTALEEDSVSSGDGP